MSSAYVRPCPAGSVTRGSRTPNHPNKLTNYQYISTRLWQLRATRAARGAPAGGSTGVAGAHKFTEGYYFLVPFRRVSRLRRPFVLRPRRRARDVKVDGGVWAYTGFVYKCYKCVRLKEHPRKPPDPSLFRRQRTTSRRKRLAVSAFLRRRRRSAGAASRPRALILRTKQRLDALSRPTPPYFGHA